MSDTLPNQTTLKRTTGTTRQGAGVRVHLDESGASPSSENGSESRLSLSAKLSIPDTAQSSFGAKFLSDFTSFRCLRSNGAPSRTWSECDLTAQRAACESTERASVGGHAVSEIPNRDSSALPHAHALIGIQFVASGPRFRRETRQRKPSEGSESPRSRRDLILANMSYRRRNAWHVKPRPL